MGSFRYRGRGAYHLSDPRVLSFEARALVLERPRVLSFEARALILERPRVLSFEARASPSHLRMM